MSKVSKKYPAKTLKIAVLYNPIFVWHPIQWNLHEYPHEPYIARN